MTLRVVPEGLAAAYAGVEALTARLAAAHAGAVPLIAAGFSIHGGQHAAVAAQGAEELGRSGVGVGESGASYASGDASVSYLFAAD
jgi:hypothetical protein